MSDDTPTQRFPSSGDDVQEDLQEEKQKSKSLLIGLLIAGAMLLVAIIVLVFFLGRAIGTPGAGETQTPAPGTSATPSETPDATPSASPTPAEEPDDPAPPPPAPTLKVDGFGVDTPTVYCDKMGGPSQIDLYFTWSTSNGNRVYFGVDTNDASAAPFFDNLPLDGDSGANFPSGYVPFQYACGTPTHKYTLTVTDGSGHKASKSVTVTDVNYNN